MKVAKMFFGLLAFFTPSGYSALDRNDDHKLWADSLELMLQDVEILLEGLQGVRQDHEFAILTKNLMYDVSQNLEAVVNSQTIPNTNELLRSVNEGLNIALTTGRVDSMTASATSMMYNFERVVDETCDQLFSVPGYEAYSFDRIAEAASIMNDTSRIGNEMLAQFQEEFVPLINDSANAAFGQTMEIMGLVNNSLAQVNSMIPLGRTIMINMNEQLVPVIRMTYNMMLSFILLALVTSVWVVLKVLQTATSCLGGEESGSPSRNYRSSSADSFLPRVDKTRRR